MSSGIDIALLIAAAAATAAGVQQQRTASKAASERERKLIEDQIAKQEEYRKRIEDITDKSAEQFSPDKFKDTQEAEADRIIRTAESLRPADTRVFAGANNAPKVIQDYQAAELGAALSEADMQARNLAAAQALSNAFFNAGVANRRGGQDINSLLNQRGRSANIFGRELAQNAATATSPSGQALQGLGQVGLNYSTGNLGASTV